MKHLSCSNEAIPLVPSSFESAGMRKHLKELQPRPFEDLISMNALYRQNFYGIYPSYINRKRHWGGRLWYTSEMEEILKETFGITVYQEQVVITICSIWQDFLKEMRMFYVKRWGRRTRRWFTSKFMEGIRAKKISMHKTQLRFDRLGSIRLLCF